MPLGLALLTEESRDVPVCLTGADEWVIFWTKESMDEFLASPMRRQDIEVIIDGNR